MLYNKENGNKKWKDAEELELQQIDQYNSYAQLVASQQGVSFFNITQLSREGLAQPELVSSDGLHFSAVAYQRVVKQIYGKAQRVVSAP